MGLLAAKLLLKKLQPNSYRGYVESKKCETRTTLGIGDRKDSYEWVWSELEWEDQIGTWRKKRW